MKYSLQEQMEMIRTDIAEKDFTIAKLTSGRTKGHQAQIDSLRIKRAKLNDVYSSLASINLTKAIKSYSINEIRIFAKDLCDECIRLGRLPDHNEIEILLKLKLK